MNLTKRNLFIGAVCITVTVSAAFQARAVAPLIPVAITTLRLGASMAQNERLISSAFAVARAITNPAARAAAEKMVSKVFVRGLATGQVAFWAGNTMAAPAPSASNFGGLLNSYNGAGSSYFSGVNNASGLYNSSSQTSLFGSQSNFQNSQSSGSAVQNAWNQGASQARLGNSSSTGGFGSSFGRSSSSGGSSGDGQGSDCEKTNQGCK